MHVESYHRLTAIGGGGCVVARRSRATSLGVRAGALLQWVLPFDNDTSVMEQWNVQAQQDERSKSC